MEKQMNKLKNKISLNNINNNIDQNYNYSLNNKNKEMSLYNKSKKEYEIINNTFWDKSSENIENLNRNLNIKISHDN